LTPGRYCGYIVFPQSEVEYKKSKQGGSEKGIGEEIKMQSSLFGTMHMLLLSISIFNLLSSI
jgi:hypothetical protein